MSIQLLDINGICVCVCVCMFTILITQNLFYSLSKDFCCTIHIWFLCSLWLQQCLSYVFHVHFYVHLWTFKRTHANGLKEIEWSNRRTPRHFGRDDATIWQCWQEWVKHRRTKRQKGSGWHAETSDSRLADRIPQLLIHHYQRSSIYRDTSDLKDH